MPNVLIASFLLFAFVSASPRVLSLSSPSLSQLPRFGVCQREGEKIVGAKPVVIGKSTRAPKKTRNVTPRYPELPKGTSIRVNSIWVGEVLVDPKGKIAQVWPIREIGLTPPFPPFNESIVTAIQQWEFEPLNVESQPVPWCMTVTVSIDLQ